MSQTVENALLRNAEVVDSEANDFKIQLVLPCPFVGKNFHKNPISSVCRKLLPDREADRQM